jgi:hypothetical protein
MKIYTGMKYKAQVKMVDNFGSDAIGVAINSHGNMQAKSMVKILVIKALDLHPTRAKAWKLVGATIDPKDKDQLT